MFVVIVAVPGSIWLTRLMMVPVVCELQLAHTLPAATSTSPGSPVIGTVAITCGPTGTVVVVVVVVVEVGGAVVTGTEVEVVLGTVVDDGSVVEVAPTVVDVVELVGAGVGAGTHPDAISAMPAITDNTSAALLLACRITTPPRVRLTA